MEADMIKKGIGLGTLSLVLCILGILFCVTFKNGKCYGDMMLTYIGLKAWWNGTRGLHYTIYYSLILLIPALALGYKFIDDLGAMWGRILSIFFIAFIFIGTFLV